MLVLLIALLLVAAAVALGLRALVVDASTARDTLDSIGAYGFSADDGERRRSRTPRERLDGFASSLGTFANRRLNPHREQELRAQLNAAGLYRFSPGKFLGYRLLATVGVSLAWAWLAAATGSGGGKVVLGLLFGAALGWLAPNITVKRLATRRLAQIDYEMPELVDLLVTAIEAGTGFSAALQLAAAKFDGPLGEELRLTLQEQAMGLTMNEALTNLLQRADTAAVRSFVQAVIQGETLGVSVGKILRDLTGEMRRRRRQVAEERAHKAATKILFPLVIFIFPTLFIVTLGPVAVEFTHGLGAG